ncbi:MAG: TIGR03960 family B12-binding radical SAM protein [Planctomycetes bacterium]|nr:TIGR03960 family B12-binding radical SAM protein [Planctomycetota bacterium]
MTLWSKIEPILPSIQVPGQYIGGEWNSIAKNRSEVEVSMAIAFPDTYKIGMSHLGIQILYKIVNGLDYALAERVFAPWVDMQYRMAENDIPLFSLETHTPVREFDIIGFSAQHEMSYTNILKMLQLSGIPLAASERKSALPLIIAGGTGIINPEPMSDFIDVFIIGDGETAVVQIVNAVRNAKKNRIPKKELLLDIARNVTGAYVPCFYDVKYNQDGAIAEILPGAEGTPEKILKAVEKDLENAPFPSKPVVPWTETVHDRINVEIMRGCPHACNFCQSKCAKTPVRTRSVQKILEYAEECYKTTGYGEMALTSLSSGDYPHMIELLHRLNARFKNKNVNISLPSLRITEDLKQLPELLNAIRKSGLTLAPEAGTDFLRKVINKEISNIDLFETVKKAYSEGWNLIKLYFMTGLPREESADIEAIPNLLNEVSHTGNIIKSGAGNVNVTISPFVPKAHTPFQWESMAEMDYFNKAVDTIKRGLRYRSIHLKYHDSRRSVLEGVFSRGDRRLGRVLVEAVNTGCQFDSWDEMFSYEKWMESFAKCGLTPAFYLRGRSRDEILPWQHIEAGFTTELLWRLREKAYEVKRQD